MGEKSEVPQEMKEASEKPTKKSRAGAVVRSIGRRIPRGVALRLGGAAAAVVTGVAGLPGVDTTGPSIARAQTKEPTSKPTLTLRPIEAPTRTPTRTAIPTSTPAPSPTSGIDKVTLSIDKLSEYVDAQAWARAGIILTQEAKKPTKEPVVKYIEREGSGGGGGGIGTFVAGAVLSAIGLMFGVRNSQRVAETVTSLASWLRIPRRAPASPPAGGTPGGTPPAGGTPAGHP